MLFIFKTPLRYSVHYLYLLLLTHIGIFFIYYTFFYKYNPIPETDTPADVFQFSCDFQINYFRFQYCKDLSKTMSNFKHFPLLLFISLSCISLALAFVKGDKYDESTFSKINGNKEKSNSGVPKELSKKSPFRLSAVGIIMLILTIILSGIFIYYFFLFYPILCRKERNYDVVEHSRDTTPTPLPTPNPENAL